MPKKMFNKPNSKLKTHIFCFDTETGGLDTSTSDVLELAGVVIDINTLEEKEDGVFGPVFIKPYNDCWDNVNPEALKKNGLIREQIEAEGLNQEVAFTQLTAFLRKFQKTDSKWDALISSGFNNIRFDDRLLTVLAKRYNYVDNNKESKLFHPIHSLDVLDLIRPWFFSTNTLESYSLENVCRFFGLSTDNAHTSLADSQNTAKILCRFLKFYRELSPRYLDRFRNCFEENNNVASN